MQLRLITLLIAFISLSPLFAQQDDLYLASTIPLELRSKSNAVVRYNKMHIEVKAYDNLTYKNTRIVTVFNEVGISDQGAVEMYNENRQIKTLEARIYNSEGKEIKKFRKNDFEDVSAVDGGTLYSDNRIKYLNYTPTQYPYTIKYEVEMQYKSTAFLPSWRPIEGYYVSTENSEYEIVNNSETQVKIKTKQFDNYKIDKLGEYHYSAKNLKSIKPEDYSPSFRNIAPELRAALIEFDMEGVKGVNSNWNQFGKWIHDELISGTEVLPESVKLEIRELTENATSDLEKAKIVYQYMQDKTRYISVQVGIGGWKPMLANDVERLSYGDCKGLSNYTKALLKEVGVEAYYAVIYGGRDIVNFDSEFSATEGNHAVLCLPFEDQNVWLECTSQSNPFGYIANFTDDRDALLITPEGGKIVHTTIYPTQSNLQNTKAEVSLSANGDMSGQVEIKTSGYQYALHEGIQNKPMREQSLYFKNYWDYLNNLNISNIEFHNDKDSIIFTEKIKVNNPGFAKQTGKRLLFQPNAFNRYTNVPTRYKQRTLDFEIERGYTDIDEYIINIDSTFQVEAMPSPVEITSKFGKYSFTIDKVTESQLRYKRIHILNKGYYSKDEYDDFRSFMSSIVKNDKSKIVLISKS